MLKRLRCVDVSPMDRCGFVVLADTTDEVMEHAMLHAKYKHGLADADVTPEMLALERSRIQDVPSEVA